MNEEWSERKKDLETSEKRGDKDIKWRYREDSENGTKERTDALKERERKKEIFKRRRRSERKG